jgi:parallel beta-helix repeat protein
MKKLLLGAALAAVAAIAPASGALASTTLVVGNDPSTCPDAQYPTINQAVVAAPSGATIRVCPGVYPEHVTVFKPVTLLGARASSTPDEHAPDSHRETVVVNDGTGAFDVTANDVKIAGFTVKGVPPATTYPDAGIFLHTGSNRVITENVIRENGLGVYVENAQDGLSVERNAFINNSRADNTGIPSGGLFACCGGPVKNTSISQNLFTGNDQFAVNVGSPNQGLQVNANLAYKESTILVLGLAQDASVRFNRGYRIGGSGILLFGGTQRAHVEYNQLQGTGPNDANGGSGIRTRQLFGAPTPNADAVIAHNDVSGFFRDGINLNDLVTSTILDNESSSNARHGLHLADGASNNVASNNQARRNGVDGLRADGTASGNTIKRNVAQGNGAHDCHDDTFGLGTAGTANTWLQNQGRTQNRAGLCPGAAVVPGP